MQKIILLLLATIFTKSYIFSQDNKSENEIIFPENIWHVNFHNNADARDFALAIGETIFVNISVDTVFRFIEKESWTPATAQSFAKAFTTPWKFDNSPFPRNQCFHPYFGSLYYVSARSNNLNFMESLATSMFGSWMWETIMENGGNSLNDLITTGTAGTLTGEIYHRLYFSFKDIFYPLAILISPVDAITELVRNKTYPPQGNLNNINLYAGGGVFFESGSSITNPAICTSMDITYGNPYGHTTKEIMDQFHFSFNAAYSKLDAYFIDSDFASTLYSMGIYTTNTASTLGFTGEYQVHFSPISLFSTDNFGITFRQKDHLSENSTLEWETNLVFTFLGTTDIYYLYKGSNTEKLANDQTPYTYNFGPGLNLLFLFGNKYLGTLTANCKFHYLIGYPSSSKESKVISKNFIFMGNTSYSHHIVGNLTAGIQASVFQKYSWYETMPQTNQIHHQAYIYLQWDF